MNNVLIIFSDQFYNVENIIKPRGSFKRLKFYNEENRKEMGKICYNIEYNALLS